MSDEPLPSVSKSDLQLWMPDWLVSKALDPSQQWFSRTWSEEERIELAVDLSRWNVEHKTGGPFGAAIFCQTSAQLVSLGVNTVVIKSDPTAHAEIGAIRLASTRLNDFRLKGVALYTSAQPCCMCLGAILWSGIRSVYFALSTAEVEAIGFDEGPLPSDHALSARGINLVHLPGENQQWMQAAQRTLHCYCSDDGLIYNGAE